MIIHADCVEAMQAMEPDSVDAIVCDPPYMLGFMGKAWDTLSPGDIQHGHDRWATEALRVLKPGGHLLAFGGTRTYHRLACAVEDAGFEIRDSLIWIYGSGFPKSLDVSKAIDRRRVDNPDWQRVGAWLRSAREAKEISAKALCGIIGAHGEVNHGGAVSNWENGFSCPTWDQWEAMRSALGFPPDMDAEVWRLNGRKGQPGENWEKREKTGEATGAQAESTGRYGGWGNDEDGDGISTYDLTAPATPEAQHWQGWGTALKPSHEPIVVARKPLVGTVAANVLAFGTGVINVDASRVGENGDAGRWPPNVALSHLPECDTTCAEGCPVAELDRQSGELTSGSRAAGDDGRLGYQGWDEGPMPEVNGDTGGASRFFYVAKASRAERNAGASQNGHPTVKPIALMRWLVRLVTPKGGTVLDPFTGSGSTGVAAVLEGFDFVGIEREAEYVALAEARVKFWAQFPGADVDKVLLSDAKAREIEASGQLGLL